MFDETIFNLSGSMSISLHNPPNSANNTSTDKSRGIMPAENTGGKYESYRNCKEDRRPRQGRYTQGNQKNYADPRGRPLIDNIDSVGEGVRGGDGACRESGRYISEQKGRPSKET